MLLRNIAVCEQTHSKCRGFAADDHILRMCYTTAIDTEEQGDRLQALVFEIDRLYQIDIAERTQQWCNANPNEECVYEGDEFIGSIWVEANKAYEGKNSWSVPADNVIKTLKDVLAEFHQNEGSATEE